MKNIKNKAFGKLQNLSWVIVLPIAGLLLEIGDGFEAYGLKNAWPTGVIVFLNILKQSGQVVFGLLGLLFCIAISFGYAKKSKGIAAMCGFIIYIVTTAVIYALFNPTTIERQTRIGFAPWNLAGNPDYILTEKAKQSGYFSIIWWRRIVPVFAMFAGLD